MTMEMLCPPTFKPRISPFEERVERARRDALARQRPEQKAALRFYRDIGRPEVSLETAYAAIQRRREQARSGGAHGGR